MKTSKPNKLVIWLLTGFLLACIIVIIDTQLFYIPGSIICILFLVFGWLQSIYYFRVYKTLQTAKSPVENIADKKTCYETLINTADDTIILLDKSGKILMINTTGAQRLGHSPDTLIGRNIFDLLPDPLKKSRSKKFQYVLTHKKTVRYVDHRQGIDFDQILSPVFDHSGDAVGVAVYGRDITAQKSIEAQLQNARQEAEKANNAKSIFLTHVSHELRTPLNVILGYTQILQSVSTLEKGEQKSLSKIHKNVDFIISLIDDILDLSKIESQNISLSIDVFEFNEFLAYISDIAFMYKQEKEVDFACHFSPDLPIYVNGDERRLKQVLLNLIVNAFKFTPKKGLITLTVKKDNQAIVFQVEDTGIGIHEDKMSDIFQPFYRLTHQSDGFGLGLSIARHLVEMMGGKLNVKSAVDKGSTFWFSLYLESVDTIIQPDDTKNRKITGYTESKKRILIVDDLKENRTILKGMISHLGFEIREANTGESALKCIHEGFEPDLILLDLIMPVMDGFEFAHQMKNNYPEITSKIVAVSASNILRSDKSVVFDAQIPKPIQRDHLIKTLEHQLDINWQYKMDSNQEANQNKTEPHENAQIPDHHILDQLIDYAQHGQITDIKDEIRKLEQQPTKYQQFTESIDGFVTELDFDGFIDYVSTLGRQ